MSNANDIVSAMAGSTNNGPVGTPTGQPATNVGQGVVDEKMYKELETKLGEQGNELGEYRTFFQNISPLLEKLDQSPEIVQAIIDGKIDTKLAKAAYDGLIDIRDATAVSQASAAISQSLGKKEMETLSPDIVKKMIEDKAVEIRKDIEEQASLKELEDKTTKFIESTEDFSKYAEEIDKWLDTHDITDIEVAYWAVKGKMSVSAAQKTADEIASENAKNLMANASGGGIHANASADGVPLIDRYVAGAQNPNNIF